MLCDEYHYAECRVLFIVRLNVVMMSVVMLSVVMLSVVMLSVVTPFTGGSLVKLFSPFTLRQNEPVFICPLQVYSC
jgi:hypothetical protein